jgi:hypothetical protein
VFWVKGDAGVTAPGGLLTVWADQSGFGQDLNYVGAAGFEIPWGGDVIDGIPCATFPHPDGAVPPGVNNIARLSPMLNRTGDPFGYGPGDHEARTIMAMVLPREGRFNIVGGCVLQFNSTPPFQCIFDLEPNSFPDAFYGWSRQWRDPATANRAPDTPPATYEDLPVLCEWRSSGYPDLTFAVNGVALPLTPATMQGTPGPNPAGTVILGNLDADGTGDNFHCFHGSIAEVLAWDHDLPELERTNALLYMRSRYPSAPIVV